MPAPFTVCESNRLPARVTENSDHDFRAGQGTLPLPLDGMCRADFRIPGLAGARSIVRKTLWLSLLIAAGLWFATRNLVPVLPDVFDGAAAVDYHDPDQ